MVHSGYVRERQEWPMAVHRNSPYIWVTWLTKLLVGENYCEWAAWFKAHYERYDKVPAKLDTTAYNLAHTSLIGRIRDGLETEGKTLFTENQNLFRLRGSTATLGGKPDLIAISGATATVVDAKVAKPSPAHHVQVMVYMYAIPRALSQYKGLTFDGKVVYDDHEVVIPSSAVDETFIGNLAQLIRRLSTPTLARTVPSRMECGFCDITKADCPERATNEVLLEGETDDF